MLYGRELIIGGRCVNQDCQNNHNFIVIFLKLIPAAGHSSSIIYDLHVHFALRLRGLSLAYQKVWWVGNIDNTADSAKPVSSAQQTALNLKINVADSYTKSQIDSATCTCTLYQYLRCTNLVENVIIFYARVFSF